MIVVVTPLWTIVIDLRRRGEVVGRQRDSGVALDEDAAARERLDGWRTGHRVGHIDAGAAPPVG